MLNLGSIQIPIAAATKTFAILAKRGAGKSYTGAVLAEEFYKAGVPFVVFDPIDVWWGLRLAQDGEGQGLPVVVFGQEHADIALDKDMGPVVAQSIVADNVSCVLSTFGMSKRAQRHLIAAFAEEMLRINNTPRHIFIEEAHEFVPQRVTGPMGTVFNAVSNLVVMGRNRGLGVTLINQRAATINKDVLTQIDTLLAFRNVAPQDRKALREWVEFHAAEGDFDEFMQTLPSLPTGEGWLWSPEFLDTFERIKIRVRETFHPDREKLGASFVMPQLAQLDIQVFIDKFTQAGKAQRPMPRKSASQFQEVKQLQQEKAALIKAYEAKLQAKDEEIAELRQKIAAVQQIVGVSDQAAHEEDALSAPAAMPTPLVTSNGQSPTITTANADLVQMWMGKLGEGTGKARILKFLADKSGLGFTRSQVALAIGMKPTSGTFNTYISHLKKNRLIVEQDGMFTVSPDLLL